MQKSRVILKWILQTKKTALAVGQHENVGTCDNPAAVPSLGIYILFREINMFVTTC